MNMRRPITIAAMLVAPVALAPAMLACPKDLVCGPCEYIGTGSGSPKCYPCDGINTPAVLELHPECCDCDAGEYFEQTYGVETLVCPGQATGEDEPDPYTDSSPWTDTTPPDTEGEPSTGEDPTAGEPDPCPGYSLYQMRGYVLGVYEQNSTGIMRWKPPQYPAGQYKCFATDTEVGGGTLPDEDIEDNVRNYEVCAADVNDAAMRAQDKCDTSSWSPVPFPADGGGAPPNDWDYDHSYCRFAGSGGGTPPAGEGGGGSPCYAYGVTVAVDTGVACPTTGGGPEECPTAECTDWNNTSHVDSPAYNIGFTADTGYTTDGSGYRVFDDHQARVDDDFWLDVLPGGGSTGLVSLCDGPWFDFEHGDLDGNFNSGDFFKELGFSTLDHHFELGATSTGTRYDVQTEWLDAFDALETDNEIYVWWRRTCIGGCPSPKKYTIHRMKVTISDCGSSPCSNP